MACETADFLFIFLASLGYEKCWRKIIFTNLAYLMRDSVLKVPAHGLYPYLLNFEGVFLETMFSQFRFLEKDRQFINFQNFDKILWVPRPFNSK